jgi:hypothetical protein
LRSKVINLTFFLCACFLAVSRFYAHREFSLNWDAPIFFDGAWRVYSGELPHHDFSSPIGPVTFMIGAIGMALSTPTVAGINLGIVLFSLSLTLLSIYMVSKSQVAGANKYLAIIVMASFVFMPRMLSSRDNWAYTGYYNLIGYACIFIIIVYCYIYKYTDEELNLEDSNILLSFILAMTAYIKITYFVVGLGITAIYFFNKKNNILIKFILNLAIFFLCFGVLIGFDYFSMFRDFFIAFEARKAMPLLLNYGNLLKFFTNNNLLGLYALCAVSTVFFVRNRKKELIFLCFFLCMSEYFLCATIMQPLDPILIFFLCTIIIIYIGEEFLQNERKHEYLYIFGIIPCCFFLIVTLTDFIFTNTATLVHSWPKYLKNKPSFSIRKDQEYLLRNFDEPGSKYIREGDNIISVGRNDIFSFLYKLKHNTNNSLLYWHEGVTFNAEIIKKNQYFREKEIFGGVNKVLLYSGIHESSTAEFLRAYSFYLSNNYEIIFHDSSLTILKSRDSFSKAQD